MQNKENVTVKTLDIKFVTKSSRSSDFDDRGFLFLDGNLLPVSPNIDKKADLTYFHNLLFSGKESEGSLGSCG